MQQNFCLRPEQSAFICVHRRPLIKSFQVRTILLAIAIGCAPAAFADEIKITTGPVDNQVFQRSADQTADFQLTGTAVGKKVNNKDVEARITASDATALPGFDWTSIGKIQKLKWTGAIKHIPTGGPYRLELRLQGTDQVISIANLLVGDLWVLAGQSNMEGFGFLIDVQQPSPLVHTFDMADRWGIAEEPLHTLVNSVDPVHWPLNAQNEPERLSGERLETYVLNRKRGAGLGLTFAVEMLQRTGTPIGLIPCAHGGTSMEQWSPSLKDREGESLYGSMLRRVKAAGGHVKGVLWSQGESDANAKAAPVFEQKFTEFVESIRADFNQPDLPFYYVQTARHIDRNNVAEWNTIQLAQLHAESTIPHSGMVASIDLELDDGIHLATQDLKRLGRRLADIVCHDLFPRIKDYGERKTGPRPLQAVYQNGVVKVNFSGVNGKLISDGRITGFTIRDDKGNWTPMIYKARIDPAEASSVLLYVQGRLPENAMLWYGYGKDPDCTMRDATDLAVPVFAMKIATAPLGTR